MSRDVIFTPIVFKLSLPIAKFIPADNKSSMDPSGALSRKIGVSREREIKCERVC